MPSEPTHLARPPLLGDVVDRHPCPSCSRAIDQVYRPGRARVYCSQACRQRAYRWRRANGVRIFVERDGPPEQSGTGLRHALRDRRDPLSRLVDRRGREVTVCGTLARPARHRRGTHDRFVPATSSSCQVCTALIGVGDDPFVGLPEAATRWLRPRARGPN